MKRILFAISFIFSTFILSNLKAEDNIIPIRFSPDLKITIDGKNNEWPKTIPFSIESFTQVREGNWPGLDAFGVKVWMLFDKENIYLFSRFTSQTPMENPYTLSNINKGDCLELFLGFHKKRKISYSDRDFHIGIALSSGKPKTWIWNLSKELKGETIVFAKIQNGYTLEARIPLSNLDITEVKEGDLLWIDFAVNKQLDKKEKPIRMVWSGNTGGERNPSVWGNSFITGKEELFLKPYILMPSGFTVGRDHRIYIYYKGLPWKGIVKFTKELMFETDSEGGITIGYDPNTMQKLSVTIDYTEYSRKLERFSEEGYSLKSVPPKNIKVNQLGYLPGEKKEFILTDNEEILSLKEFSILSEDGSSVYKGKLTGPFVDSATGDTNYYGDFSSFTKTGKYQITVTDFEPSYTFEISPNIMKSLFYTTMRSYYLQRCGIKIDDRISKVQYGPCHLDDGYLRENKSRHIDTTGGWHDAGDYGKYIPSAGSTLANLLLLYEMFPSKFKKFKLDIPESENSIPDILDELKYELDWMLKMQDKNGGVYHKVNTYDFPGPIPPQDDKDIRLIYEIGTPDTAIFAGTMAMASRVYKAIDQKYSATLREAALKATSFLIKNKGQTFWPMNDKTGAYQTGDVKDELFWAFSEVYRITEDKKYYKLAMENQPRFLDFNPIGWDDFSGLAILALLKSSGTPREIKTKLLSIVKQQAEWRLSIVKKSTYKVALAPAEYKWASNKNALAYGVNFIIAYQFVTNKEFIEAARNQIDYVLGVNTLSKSFVTMVGTDYPKNPHHRILQSTSILVPGLLVGGPNSNAEDGQYPQSLGARGYVDKIEAFSCNEYAIDYNAPLVFLAGYFMKEGNKKE